jgi:hypothetical protein
MYTKVLGMKSGYGQTLQARTNRLFVLHNQLTWIAEEQLGIWHQLNGGYVEHSCIQERKAGKEFEK